MSSNFQDGDLIEVNHIKQYSGEAYYSVASGGSTSSAYLATVTPPPLSAYPVGMVVHFKPNADNSASPTLNVNGLGAKAIVKNGFTPLAAADIKNGQVISLVYDGTNFQLVAASAGGSSSVAALNDLTDVTISSPATGQVLRKSAGDWVNSALQASDLPSHNHDGSQITTGQVAPARLSSNAPNSAQFLRGDGTWAPVSGGATNLDGLTDVTISTPTTGQFLRKSAGDWVNSAIQASDLPGSIDAANIGGGVVSNAEFATLDGVTSSIQTQLNGKAASSHTHAAADITSGQLGLARGGTGADLSATGGAGQVLKQSSPGGPVSVGALAAGDVPSGIDAAKIGGGAVSNAEFATLDGVSSSIQTQLNGKAASSHTHAAADITSGQLGLARGGTGADLSATGGAGQVLKQSSPGGPVSVGALAAGDVPSGIDAAKIGGGTVSNAEFAALDGVIANVQSQISGTRLVGGGANLLNVDQYSQRYLGLNPFKLGAGTGLSSASYQTPNVPGGLVYRMYGTGPAPTLSYIGSTFYTGLIPVDTQKTYSGRIWMSSSGGSACYCGVRCWSESGAVLGGGAYKYFVLGNVTPPSSGAWYEGLISGEGSNSYQFEVGTKFVDFVVLAGYGTPSGSWEAYFSVPEFVELPNNLGPGTKMQGTGGSGHFLTQSSLNGSIGSRVLAAGDLPSHTHSAADITSGVLATARLGTGIASTSTFLRGDGSWSSSGSIPIGMVAPFAGSTAPTGWLLCYGQNVSRATYSALRDVLNYAFGSGDGSTTFGLPDLRGRVVAGLNNMGGTGSSALNGQSWSSTLGQSGAGGSQSHTLSTSEMPSHNHSTISYGYFNAYVANQALNAVQNYSQGFTVTGSAGSGLSHNNVQPTMVLN